MTTFEALMKIATLLAKGNVKESLEYYNEPTESAPPLSECTYYLEELLDAIANDKPGFLEGDDHTKRTSP